LQDYRSFINYRIGSHKHLDKLLLPPFVLLLLLFHHLLLRDEELGWMDDGTDDGTDGWKGRPPPSQPDKTKDIIFKERYSQQNIHAYLVF
jgi:hypothetical protein